MAKQKAPTSERRKPDYNVYAWLKDSELRGTVGVAWKGENDTIDIKLSAFIVLPPGIVLRLYPYEASSARLAAASGATSEPPPTSNIPF